MSTALTPPEIVSTGRRLAWHAAETPDKTALIFVARDGSERSLTYAELERQSNQLARLVAAHGIGEGATVAIGLPNCLEHVVACLATWKLGGMTLPLRAAMPAPERDALLDLAKPALTITDWGDISWPSLSRADLIAAEAHSAEALPDNLPNPGRAMASSGSTGRPKLIVRKGPWGFPIGALPILMSPLDFQSGVVGFIPGPLYHELPFLSTQMGIFEGNTIILMEHFDAAMAVDIIERHRPVYLYVAPINLQRIAELPDVKQRDLSSLTSVGTTGSMIPHWVKRAWFNLIGPEHVYEIYGGTEGIGYAMGNGRDWLERPGTVGRPHLAEMKILDEEGVELQPGEVGRIFSRNTIGSGPTFEYVGAQPAVMTEDGFTWIGDLGWMDEEGFLYLADRRADLIISGGANVFAAEVEGVISEHLSVADIAVIGLPDDTWGKRVHAIIQPHDIANPPDPSELSSYCRKRLSAYKCPKTWEFIAELPRTEAGKMRRSALAAERIEQSDAAQQAALLSERPTT